MVSKKNSKKHGRRANTNPTVDSGRSVDATTEGSGRRASKSNANAKKKGKRGTARCKKTAESKSKSAKSRSSSTKTVDSSKTVSVEEPTTEGSGHVPSKPGGSKKNKSSNRVGRKSPSAATCNKDIVVRAFVQRSLMRKEPVQALIADFRGHKRANDFTKMTVFLENQDKNRYKDVGCLDNNRVVLRLGKQPYIHANYVGPRENPKKFICCQAPLDSTIADFWTMVAQEKSQCIVMLCNYTERNLPKCAQYLPSQKNVPQAYGEVTVTLIDSDTVHFKSQTSTVVVMTTLEVTYLGDNSAAGPSTVASNASTMTAAPSTHRVVHYHWMDWPDRGVPPADEAPIELVQAVQKYAKVPIIVHCSAGIGRTGCFVLVDILLDQLDRGIAWPDDLMSLVLEMRGSRNNSIQTEQQYLYVHQIMLNFLRSRKLFSPPMVDAHTAWSSSYTTTTSGFQQ